MNVVFTCEQRNLPPVRITDFEDHLLLIRPLRVIDWRHPDGNRGHAVVADVVVLDAEDGPQILRDTTIIQGALVRSLKRRMGQRPASCPVTTLARLVREPSKRRQDHLVWVFGEPTENDVDLAQLYLDEYGDPFTAAAA